MFHFTRPSQTEIDQFFDSLRSDTFSYPHVGATGDSAQPDGYVVDHNRQLLGCGRETFERAKQSVRRWKMFDVPGLKLIRDDTPIEPGRDVALLAKHLGFYSLSSCRIVYVIDEPERFGFAYGTLSQHAESGEERFTVEYHRQSDEVWYDIYAFSRPGHFLVRLGYPYARYLQKRFAVTSKAAMLRAAGSTL
jgi:uncharacterized protein (UPF0548 family)